MSIHNKKKYYNYSDKNSSVSSNHGFPALKKNIQMYLLMLQVALLVSRWRMMQMYKFVLWYFFLNHRKVATRIKLIKFYSHLDSLV